MQTGYRLRAQREKEDINNPHQTNNVRDLPGNNPASTCNLIKNVSALVITALNTSLSHLVPGANLLFFSLPS
jgi:hypothetical protein